MDNFAAASPGHRVRFVPDRRYTLLAAAGMLLALAGVLLAPDPEGRVLAGVALLVLGALVAGDLVFSPRLEADADGLTIRAPLTRARLAWHEIETVRADVRRRHGLRSSTLEVDAGDVLAVFSRRALGADPERAAELIAAVRGGG